MLIGNAEHIPSRQCLTERLIPANLAPLVNQASMCLLSVRVWVDKHPLIIHTHDLQVQIGDNRISDDDIVCVISPNVDDLLGKWVYSFTFGKVVCNFERGYAHHRVCCKFC